MTPRETTRKAPPASEPIENRLVAFADQLGSLVGTIRARAGGLLDRSMLTTEIGRIRESAADLLAHLHTREASPKPGPAKKKVAPATRSRGPVDAPGKRHRKPVPQERIDKRMGEPQGKQMGQKNFKAGRRSGRS